eukprot:182589-Alexandrium_andersonii.AAC.1
MQPPADATRSALPPCSARPLRGNSPHSSGAKGLINESSALSTPHYAHCAHALAFHQQLRQI